MHATSAIRRTSLLALCCFLAPANLRAAVHAGIEIGGKGVKATVVEVTGEGEDMVFKTKLSHTTNTALSAGVAKDGRFAPDAMSETARAVKAYYQRIRKDFDVPAAHIYVVGSSGLFAPIQDKPELIKKNQDALAEVVKEKTGLTPTFISARREAELSILGELPRGRRKTGLLIDIGGGNTKGGYLAAPGKFATFNVPFGTVTFTEYAKKKDAAAPKALVELAQKTLPPLLKKELAGLPELAKRDRIYLSGGVVWAVTTFAHPGDGRPYTPLTLKDVEQVEAKLLAAPGAYPTTDLAAVTDGKSRRRAEAELARVKKVYRAENLLGGIQVLKSAMQEVGGEKHFYFVRQGYLGWILAYVTEAAEKAPAP